MMRPELLEMKHQIRNLKKDAEMRLTLDMEAQQSFEFLSDQARARACARSHARARADTNTHTCSPTRPHAHTRAHKP
eukprot:3626388-Pleurochrysis_carterae.AAC.4